MTSIEIVQFNPIYASAFKALNEAWITKFFKLEPEDINTLNNPQKIIDEGGYIFIALHQGVAVGVCALKKVNELRFEFSKMAVNENLQGMGVGRKLINSAIHQARSMGVKTLFLEGNTLLEASIHLYKSVGFKETEGGEAHYERVNITMEMNL